MIKPRATLMASALAVGLGAALLPWYHGHPTVLEYVVALGGWGLVAFAKSSHFADAHFPLVWSAAVLLNMLAFSVPGFLIWLGLRRRNPRLCSALLGIWCLGYLALLTMLFPVSAGA